MATTPQLITSIILAAGRGTRMRSKLPKVLHPVCGVPIVKRVKSCLRDANIENHILVLGETGSHFASLVADPDFAAVVQQKNRLGTADAVAACHVALEQTAVPSYAAGNLLAGAATQPDYVIITAADTPALDPAIIADFISESQNRGADLSVIGMIQPTPFGYGRLVVENGRLQKIVEEKDASATERQIQLCNSGVIFAKSKTLFELLSAIDNHNSQGEYYLTDCFKVAEDRGLSIYVHETDHFQSFAGVNTRRQLAAVEQWLQTQLKNKWMDEGVSFTLPDTSYLDDSVTLAADVQIAPGCVLTGNTVLASGTRIGANSSLHNVRFGTARQIPAGSQIADTEEP